MGISTIALIVRQVCEAIWEVMAEECLPEPTLQKWQEIAFGFQTKANFPNCIGALDGKHIRVIKPIKRGSLFMNYKHYFSIALLGICDSNYCFTYIDVGAYGRNSDSAVFKDSIFWKKLEANQVSIPSWKPLPDTSEPLLPHVLVADEGFGLSEHVVRPYSRKNLNYNKKIFNYRLTRARRYIECAFGILSNKWRIFHRPLNVDIDLAVSIVKTCSILHNFVRVRDGYNFEETLTVVGFQNLNPSYRPTCNRSFNSIRDTFANYFVTTGKVPWQDSKIH